MVNIADPLAYCAHDLEDALNAGYLGISDARDMDNPLMNKVLKKCTGQFSNFLVSDTVLQSRLLVRTLIEEANVMVIRETRRNLEQYKINSVDDARRTAMDIVAAPAADWEDFNLLKDYLYDNVYKKAQVCIMNEKGKLVVRRMFEHLEKAPEMMPGHWRTRYTQAGNRAG